MTMDELLRLINKYGAASTSYGFRVGDSRMEHAEEANQEAMAHYEKIIAEVRRLHRELGEDDGSYVGDPGPDG